VILFKRKVVWKNQNPLMNWEDPTQFFDELRELIPPIKVGEKI